MTGSSGGDRATRYVFAVDVDPGWADSDASDGEHADDPLWQLARPDLGELYNYDESKTPWIMVIGGGLEASVYLQLGWSRDLRLIVTRLIVGTGPVEITSQTLRTIPLASILAQFVEDYDAAGELSWPEDWQTRDSDPDADKWFVHRMLKRRLPQHWMESRSGQRGGSPDALELFAQVYLGFLASDPRRAMTLTAKKLNMSRATANRRADECRRRGLLPARASP